MKLQRGAGHERAGGLRAGGGFIHEQQHGRDQWRQPPRQRRRPRRRDVARAFGVEHKADGIRASGHGGVHILLAREAADFDSGAWFHVFRAGFMVLSGLAVIKQPGMKKIAPRPYRKGGHSAFDCAASQAPGPQCRSEKPVMRGYFPAVSNEAASARQRPPRRDWPRAASQSALKTGANLRGRNPASRPFH